MRLLIDMQGAQNGSRLRGIGRYVNALVRHLIAAKAEDDEIFLLLNGELLDGEKAVRAEYSNLLVPQNFLVWYPLSPSSWGDSRNISRRLISQAIREWAIREVLPDCILVSSLFEGCGDDVVTTISPDQALPTAVIFYDLIPYLFPDQYLGNHTLRGWYSEKLQFLERADLLLAISQASAVELIELLEIPDDRVANISSGIDAAFFQQPGAPWPETAKKHGVSGRYLLYAGAADPRKNLESFLRAFGTLNSSQIHDVSIVFVGRLTIGQQKTLKSIASSFPRGKKQLICVGHVTDEELIAFYRNALGFIFPSVHEGFGLPLLEAMAAGCPVIASNCTAFPEVVGVPEALFDPHSLESMANLMLRLIQDDDYRKWLVAKQGGRVALFSWVNVAERAWVALRGLVANKSNTHSGEINSSKFGRGALINSVAVQLRDSGAPHGHFIHAAEAIEKTVVGMQLS